MHPKTKQIVKVYAITAVVIVVLGTYTLIGVML